MPNLKVERVAKFAECHRVLRRSGAQQCRARELFESGLGRVQRASRGHIEIHIGRQRNRY